MCGIIVAGEKKEVPYHYLKFDFLIMVSKFTPFATGIPKRRFSLTSVSFTWLLLFPIHNTAHQSCFACLNVQTDSRSPLTPTHKRYIDTNTNRFTTSLRWKRLSTADSNRRFSFPDSRHSLWKFYGRKIYSGKKYVSWHSSWPTNFKGWSASFGIRCLRDYYRGV